MRPERRHMSARTTALTALIATRRQGAWSDGILKEYIRRDRLDRRDAALCAQLVYGVLQNRLLLDYYLKQVVTGGLSRLQPAMLDILRLGAYQILCLDRIPDSAAVNEAVEQTKRYVNKSAASMTNGALRALSRQKDTLQAPQELATKYSHPQALVSLLAQNVPAGQLEALLKADNEPAPTSLQVNPLLAAPEEVEAALAAQEISFAPHPWLSGCYLVRGTGDVGSLDLFASGRVYVQDASARLAAMASGVMPGMEVLDVCAAPGGKSFAAAIAMENRGHIVSCDIHAHKIALIEKGAQRLGISILEARQADASKPYAELEGGFDVVIADVPCSGLGVIRKKPDIRYKDLAPLEKLPAVQRAILENVSRYVRPGGVLLYSTCTILRRENEAVAQDFLARHPEFSAEAFALPFAPGRAEGGMVTILPTANDADGFFICKLRKHL